MQNRLLTAEFRYGPTPHAGPPFTMTIRLRNLFVAASAVLFTFVLLAAPVSADEIFPDEKLRAVIKEILVKKQINKETIEEADLKTIYFLDAPEKGIKDLTGLDKCTNLASVKLPKNEIESVAALAALKNVQELHLQHNKIADIAPLGEMPKLQYIQLEHNQVAKLDGLEKLSNLRSLYLSNNQVESLTPLSSLSKLTSLYLNDNKVSDLTPIKDLKWIDLLGLKNNQISDLSPLANFTELRFTFLEGNPLTDLSVLVAMAQKDVEGDQRFAPYWRLYLDVDKLPETGKAQVEELTKLGVRINNKS